MFELPPLPAGVDWLNDLQVEDLHRRMGAANLQGSLDNCRTCSGTKAFRWLADPASTDENPEIVDYRCNCRDQFKLSRYLMYHNVGKTPGGWCWGDVQHVPQDVFGPLCEYADQCVDYANRGVGLYLYSETGGIGKTLMSALLLKRFLANGIEGYWTTFAHLLQVYTGTFRDNAERAWFDQSIRLAPVLVLDDLGKEPKGLREVTDAALDNLLRTRVQNGLVTIFTSNIEPDKIYDNYTSSLGSLVTEACLPFHFVGSDYRAWASKRRLWEIGMKLTRPWTMA